MAFRNKNLSVIAYANGFTLWYYSTNEDSFMDVCSVGYFNDVKTLCATGDIVIINSGNNTGLRKMRITDDGNVVLELLK